MRYHLIGNKGVSMRGIAKILQKEGHKVTGSDLKNKGHNASNIKAGVDLVVRSSAISPGSAGWVEVLAAKKLGIPVVKRSAFLGELTSDKFLIAISGMHGKTTVTALCGLLLIKAKLDPTVLIGERLEEFDDEVVRIGKSKYFVMEACEYDRSFLDFKPNIAIITNIDFEHPDTYPSGLSDIKKAFSGFLSNIKANGAVIAWGEDKNLRQIVCKSRPDIKKIFYGEGTKHSKMTLPMKLVGSHNQTNALAACALADYLKIDKKYLKQVLASFEGAKRRLEYKGEAGRAKVFDDYGHHPTEITATISALKKQYSNQKIVAVFWPHQYKRILPLKDEFIKALAYADQVILKPIYLVPGRDQKLRISSEDIASGLRKRKVSVDVIESNKKIVEILQSMTNDNIIILTIGIPPIYKVADLLVSEKQ